MKKYTIAKLQVFLLLLFMIEAAYGAEEVPQSLPGSEIRIQDVAAKADVIVVGKIVNIGFGVTGANGQATLANTKVQVEKILKGELKDKVIFITIKVQWEEGVVNEKEPEVGSAYILFLKDHKESGEFEVLKMLPSNLKTIKEVQAALAKNVK